MDQLDLLQTCELDETPEIIERSAPAPAPKATREQLRQRLRERQAEKRDVRTRAGRAKMMQEAGEAAAQMQGEGSYDQTVRQLSRQLGAPPHRVRKLLERQVGPPSQGPWQPVPPPAKPLGPTCPVGPRGP